jgi:hypothetical protein
MAHPEVALHPIHGPDGKTALPKGHPMHRAGDEKLPAAWPREFVDEMVAGGFAAKPNSKAAKDIAAERAAAEPGVTTVVETGVRG